MPQQEFIQNHLPENQETKPDVGARFIAPEDVRSEEVTEIIGRVPHWIIRRGITIIAILCFVILIGAYFFKYPDLIPAKVSISSGNPPVKLVARNSLPIQKIFVTNDQIVNVNQPLCVFLNTARYDDVMNIATVVAQLDTSYDIRSAISALTFPTSLQLGELQSNYIELFQTVQSYKFFLHNNAYDATIGSLSSQVGYSNQLQAEQYDRQHLLQKQMMIQQRQFDADSSLLNAKIISRVEYEESQKRMLEQQMSSGSNKTATIQNKLQESEYRKNIALTTLQKQSEENELVQKTKDAIRRFQSAFAQWEQNFVLKSPAMGKVSFFNIWKENQFVNAGEGVMMIIPPTQNFVVRGTTGIDRYGKIKTGQKALLKLQSYSYEEYGMLEAQLTKRSLVAMDNNYAIEMKLKHGLVTNSGKTIPTSPVLEAEAEIITEDKSVLERLFEKMIRRLK
jgi:multidrug efflux pump subunit AcrA (membrane-fusion protein)